MPKKVKAPKALPPCRHPRLHFEAGGYHVVCSGCGHTWNSVGHCPARFIIDPMARAQGLTEFDVRSDPTK